MDLSITKIPYVDLKICNSACTRIFVFDDIETKEDSVAKKLLFREFCWNVPTSNCIIMLE